MSRARGPGRLVLRPPGPQDEAVCRAAHAELAADHFDFLLHHELTWAEQLALFAREAAGVDLPRGRVPSDFLLAEVDGVVVGRSSVRHRLTPALLAVGGHVGYAVRPAFRRRGHATAILRESLHRCHEQGIPRVLVTCDDGNLASARTIEACGGVLEDVLDLGPGVPPTRRYWIG